MEPFLGQIAMFPSDLAPDGWLPCDGRILPILGHQKIFSVVGYDLGGDGRDTFALPDLRGRLAFDGTLVTTSDLGFFIAVLGVFPSRQ